MHAQNIAYREITLTPYTHIVHQDKGLTLEDVLLGLEKGRQQAFDDFGVEMRWVFDIHRNLAFSTNGSYDYNAEPAERTLDFAIAGKQYGVVGLGLGGDEVNAPPEPFADVFYRAKDAGLLSVPHAGETEGPNSVKGAVTHLYADRIGHGVRAIEDPAVVELVKEKQIPLEVNISSNVCLHVYGSIEEHPFKRLDQAGVLLTVNSDDPPLFSTTLSKEYEILATDFGYTLTDLVRFARNAFLVSGAELEVKKRLLNKFDTWVSSVD
jgi:aminodeoxyfutalosine deaminase